MEKIKEIVVCDLCDDTGEIPCMDYVYNNEPHTAMVGSRKCSCQLKTDDIEWDD